MPELKQHLRAGRMNKDLDERLVPNGEYRDAQNIEIVTSEGSNVGSVQNVLGNSLKDGRTYDENQNALTLWGSNSSSIKDLTNPECIGYVVDEQNKDDSDYQKMGSNFSGFAFQASLDLALKGANQPSGYTEPLLHKWRLEFKKNTT